MVFGPLGWLGRLPASDPLERRTAVTVQVFCIGLTVLLLVNEAIRVSTGRAAADASAIYGVFADYATIAASMLTVALIRRGYVREGFVTVIGSYVAVLAGSLVLRGLAYHQHLLVRVYWVLLVLPALLLGRRALWSTVAVLLSAMLIGHLRDSGQLGGSGPNPPLVPALGLWGQAVAVMLLLCVILDRFGTALREAYTVARTRQLAAEKASEELAVANQSLADEMKRRTEAEALLVQSQKLEAIGRLSAGVAHDFNNVLTAIMGFAELARMSLEPGDSRGNDIDQIIEAGRRAGGLTRQLLAFARRQIVEPRILSVEQRAEELGPMLRRLLGEGVDLVKRFDADPWNVLVDPTQLDQVLLNLALNARDAMPDGGTLTFATEKATFGAVDRATRPDLEPGDYVRLTITDTGSGMAPATLANVFEPFFTTKERGQGTGLGLATCYGIIRQAKGVIAATSRVGEGTSFEILLPRAREDAHSGLRGSPALSGRRRRTQAETVLVVDDEPNVVAIAARVLAAEGYRVLTASGPVEAARVAAAHAGDIALVLTDVVMPQTNGRTFVEELRRSRPGIVVLYMSGHADDVVAHHGVLDPGVDLLSKPFEPDALVKKVGEALDARQAPRCSEATSRRS